MKNTVCFINLGCPKNLVDSEVMGAELMASGYEVIDQPERADVVVINTCGFIDAAKEESLDEIFSHLGRGRGRLVVSGCLAQRYADELQREIPEIGGMVGVNDLAEIPTVVRGALAGRRLVRVSPSGDALALSDGSRRRRQTPRHFGYVRIAQGCSRLCHFCAIPAIRGPYRSKEPELIFAETRALVSDGAREVVLIAQDTTRYGLDIPGADVGLASLLWDLSRRFPEIWFRLMYAHPAGIDDDLLEVIRERDNICDYLDIPLQHISPEVLRRMGRSEDPALVRRTLERIRAQVPDISLRSAFIVGYPQETEEDFRLLLDFVAGGSFDHVGVFAYSREEGTRAHSLPGQVGRSEKQRRRNQLVRAALRRSREVKERLVGSILPVLIDGTEEGNVLGRHQGQAPEVDGYVFLGRDSSARIGEVVPVEITGADSVDLWGRILHC
ncbi:MAG: 30S ribosomal protein S12 methylthiotransferase RimO [Bacillota bacterium]